MLTRKIFKLSITFNSQFPELLSILFKLSSVIVLSSILTKEIESFPNELLTSFLITSLSVASFSYFLFLSLSWLGRILIFNGSDYILNKTINDEQKWFWTWLLNLQIHKKIFCLWNKYDIFNYFKFIVKNHNFSQ